MLHAKKIQPQIMHPLGRVMHTLGRVLVECAVCLCPAAPGHLRTCRPRPAWLSMCLQQRPRCGMLGVQRKLRCCFQCRCCAWQHWGEACQGCDGAVQRGAHAM